MAKKRKKKPQFEFILASGRRNYVAERINGYLWLLHDEPLDTDSAAWLYDDLKNDPETYALLNSGKVDLAGLYRRATEYQRIMLSELPARGNALRLAKHDMDVWRRTSFPSHSAIDDEIPF